MSSEFSKEDEEMLKTVMGEAFGKEFLKIIDEFKRSSDDNKRIADARWSEINTKLDTIIAELRKE